MIVWLFPFLAACGIGAAYFLKMRLSGAGLSNIKVYSCLVFNGFFVVPYIDIIQSGDFLFLGHRPDIISEHPFIGWIALFCILIHSSALPVERKLKWWFSRK